MQLSCLYGIHMGHLGGSVFHVCTHPLATQGHACNSILISPGDARKSQAATPPTLAVVCVHAYANTDFTVRIQCTEVGARSV